MTALRELSESHDAATGLPAGGALYRFAAVYLTIYMVNLVPRPLSNLVATRVFGAATPLSLAPTGSGDRAIDWAMALCALVEAVIVTAAWALLDRRPRSDQRLRQWSQFGAAVALGSVMVSYGMMKVFPVQMPAPSLQRLLQPLGQFSSMGVLWTFIGVSPTYEAIIGTVELLGGVMLFWPRTAIAGALVCLVAAVQIFALNLAYDVPVKLFSLHLIVLATFLLAPHASRLLAAVTPDEWPKSSNGSSVNRPARLAWLVARTTLALLVVAIATSRAYQTWSRFGTPSPRSPLYGVWTVADMRVDGVVRPPLVTDGGRWRRVVFDRPSFAAFQRMDDGFEVRMVDIDTAAHRIDVFGLEGGVAGQLQIAGADPAVMLLTGTLDAQRLEMRLERVDHTQFTLEQRRLHWIQERPFNR